MEITNKDNLSKKKRPSSQEKPHQVKEIQALTIAELDEIAGAGLRLTNHNQTLVSFSK